MAKTSGLGDNLMVGGYDLSLDVLSVDSLTVPIATQDVTGIKQLANARLLTLRDADMQFTSSLDTGSGTQAPWVDNLHTLPRTDQACTYFRGNPSLGPALGVVGDQIGYDPTRDASGTLTFKTEIQADGHGGEWGVGLTGGTIVGSAARQDSAATVGPAIDTGLGFATPGVPASNTPVTNTSPLPATVVISGGTMTNVSVGPVGNLVTVGSGAGTYTVPPSQQISMTYTVAPTWTWTLQTLGGGSAYFHLLAFTGTSVTIDIQSCTTSGGTYVSTGLTTAALTSAGQGIRLQTASNVTINEFIKVVTIGTFSSALFAVSMCRNPLYSGVNF